MGHLRDHIIDKNQIEEYYADPINAESGVVMPEPEVVFKLRTKKKAPAIPITDYAIRNNKKLLQKIAAMDRDYHATTWGNKHSRSKTGGYHNMKGF